MTEKTLPRALTCLLALAVSCIPALAQRNHPLSFHVSPGANSVVTPYHENLPAATAVIFTNFGTGTTVYYPLNGWVVAGPNETTFTGAQWVGIPFTAKANSHATTLQAALGYLGGTNAAQLELYADDGSSGTAGVPGNPGTRLATANVRNLQPFGTCCTVTATGKIGGTTGIALTAGTIYWMVMDTSATSDFAGAVAFSNDSLTDFNLDDGNGWSGIIDGGPAVKVSGTVP